MKRIRDEKHKCPLCKGKGFIIGTGYSTATRERARKLYAKGVSLRKIGKKLNINHPQKVYSLITAKYL